MIEYIGYLFFIFLVYKSFNFIFKKAMGFFRKLFKRSEN